MRAKSRCSYWARHRLPTKSRSSNPIQLGGDQLPELLRGTGGGKGSSPPSSSVSDKKPSRHFASPAAIAATAPLSRRSRACDGGSLVLPSFTRLSRRRRRESSGHSSYLLAGFATAPLLVVPPRRSAGPLTRLSVQTIEPPRAAKDNHVSVVAGPGVEPSARPTSTSPIGDRCEDRRPPETRGDEE